MSDENEFVLSDEYVLWFHDVVDSSWSKDSYKNLCFGIQPDQSIHSGKELWRAYRSLNNNITAGMFFLMRKGIDPMWEDPANASGGFWSFKVPKACANDVWAQLSAAFVGNTLTKDPKRMVEITGISVSPKISNCVMKIWNRNAKVNKPQLLTTDIRFLDTSSVMYRKHSR